MSSLRPVVGIQSEGYFSEVTSSLIYWTTYSSIPSTNSCSVRISRIKLLGDCWFRGVAGERFAVRNSGSVAVVEAVGDHACEYMTGGRVIVLGSIGRNFAAAMSGGIAFLFNRHVFMDISYSFFCAYVQCSPSCRGDPFVQRINVATVDLDTPTEEDLIFVRDRIKNFIELTGSELGQRVLDNWQVEHERIIKVRSTSSVSKSKILICSTGG